MDVLQIYSRRAMAWSAKYPLQVGYQENWVLDKTTDTAKDIVIYISGAETEPDLEINDWVRLMHVNALADGPTYTAAGRPDNHTEYLIGAFNCLKLPRQNKWKVDLTLIEPIERFRGVLGETLSYTNTGAKTVYDPSTGANIDVPEYKYNHLSALERWLKVTPANCDNYASGYNPRLNLSWYNRITMSAADKAHLQSLPFADNTLNELSLYDLLMDVYDSSTGRTPVAYFDVNTTTGEPNNPNRDEYLLCFERQDGLDKDVIAYEDLVAGCSMENISKTLDNYATGLVSNVDNLAPEETCIFPAQYLFAVPEVDDESVRDVSSGSYGEGDDDKSDNWTPTDAWVIKLPHPIKSIKKLVKVEAVPYAYLEYGSIPTYYRLTRQTTDVTSKVLEYQQYVSADLAGLGVSSFDKNTAYWYKEGESKIHIREYIGGRGAEDANNDNPPYYDRYKAALLYQIEYVPLINARIQTGSADYVQQVNQTASQVDSEKFGKFLSDYLARMGKADITIAKTCGRGKAWSYDDVKDMIGSRVVKGDKTYLITAVSQRNRNFQYDVFFQLNEHHLRKNMAYQASSDIRTNAGIPAGTIKNRRINLKAVCFLGLSEILVGDYDYNEKLEYDKRDLLYALLSGGVVLSAAVALPGSPQVAVTYTASSIRLLPITKFVLDNQVIISLRLPDNTLAGTTKTIGSEAAAGSVPAHWRGNVILQVPKIYTDYAGRFERLGCDFVALNPLNLPDITDAYSESTAEQAAEMDAIIKKMALLPLPSDLTFNRTIVSMREQFVAKDTVEALNESVAFEARAKNTANGSLIVCPDLLHYSRLMQVADSTSIKIYFRATNSALDTDLSNNIAVRTIALYPVEAYDSVDDFPDSGGIGLVYLAEDTGKVYHVVLKTVSGPPFFIMTYEELSEGCVRVITNSSGSVGTISYHFAAVSGTVESCVITGTYDGHEKKLLILNDLSTFVKAQIASGRLDIYFG